MEFMDKKEFIDRLRAALNGRVSPSVVAENVNYYEDYINTEIRKGRSEQEIMQSLGDPRLIARTIIETMGKGAQENYQSTGYTYNSYQSGEEKKGFRLPVWLWLVIVLLLVVGIIGAVFSVLSFLAPIILPIILIIFCVKLFRDWLN